MRNLQGCSSNCVSVIASFLTHRDVHAWCLTSVQFRNMLTDHYRQKKSWHVHSFFFYSSITLPNYVRDLKMGDFSCFRMNLQFVHTLSFFGIHRNVLHEAAMFFPPSLQSLTLQACKDVSLSKLFMNSPNHARYSMLTYLQLSDVMCTKKDCAAFLPPSLTTIKFSKSQVRIQGWPSCLTSLSEKAPQFWTNYSVVLPPQSLRKWKTYNLTQQLAVTDRTHLSYPHLTYLQIYDKKVLDWNHLFFFPVCTLTTLKLPNDFSCDDVTLFTHANRSLHTLAMPAYGFHLFAQPGLFTNLNVLTLNAIGAEGLWKGIVVQCKNIRNLTLISYVDVQLGSLLCNSKSITHLHVSTPNWISFVGLPPCLKHLELTCLRIEVPQNSDLFPSSIRSLYVPKLCCGYDDTFCSCLLNSKSYHLLNRLVIPASLRASCRQFLCSKNTPMRWMVYKRIDGTTVTIEDLPMTLDRYDRHMILYPSFATSTLPSFDTCLLVNEHAGIF